MQVSYNNDTALLIDSKAVTPARVKKIQEDPAVTSYSFHKPGSVFTMRDGRQYQVQPNGSWKVLNKPRSRVKRLRDERRASKR
jgi:hypothetical protein